MKDRYQVKFEHPEKGTVYGIAEMYGPEAKKYAKKKQTIVADAITPETYLVADDNLIDIDFNFGLSEYDKYIAAEYQKAQAVSDKLTGVKVGKLFSIGVADGYAVYVITKVTKSSVDVEWRGFGGGDRYIDHYFGWGRKRVPLAEVKRYVDFTDGMKKIFARAR